MSETRPTVTPALLTGARILRPPMLSKRASTLYASPPRSDPRLPTLSESTRSAAKPAATKAPNHRSIVVLSILFFVRELSLRPAAEHQRGEDEVEGEDGERGAHHGAGGRPRDALRGGRRIVAL